MTKRARFVSFALALVIAGALSGAATSSEPRNLSLLKGEIIDYIDSGRYADGIAAVAKEARAWIEERAKTPSASAGAPRPRLAVVFDIDETMLSNLPHIRGQDFGYQAEAWNAWVARGEAPVIEPVREVYRTARKLGIEVIFITGRRDRDRPGTEKNLRAAGVGDYAALLVKPDASKETTAYFKAEARRRLIGEGYVIIANIGDQESDFEGGYAEKNFKLPDPFYITR